MQFKLKVRRDASALVILVEADLALNAFAVCRCDEKDFREALKHAQARVALPLFLVGGDFAIAEADHILDLRGVVAIDATEASLGAVASLDVPLLMIGGSRRLEAAARDVSRLVYTHDKRIAAEVVARFIGAYS